MSQVRIIAGTHRSRRIEVTDADGLRPTTDRIREVLFNWLGHDLYGLKVLDLYAGSGALGFEAASRGASEVLMIDFGRSAVKQLMLNNEILGFEQVTIKQGQAQSFVSQSQGAYDVIFLDPPFDSDEMNAISAIISGCCQNGGLLYREYRKNQAIQPMDQSIWQLHKQKTAGQVCFELWQKKEN